VSTSPLALSHAVAATGKQPVGVAAFAAPIAGQAQAALPTAPWQVSGDIQAMGVPALKHPSLESFVQVSVCVESAQSTPAVVQVFLQIQEAAPPSTEVQT
jgi:hypothetical protein